MSGIFDVVVLGSTPAGYASALYLARKGKLAVVVDAPHQPAESPLADWVPPNFFKLPHLPRDLQTRSGARMFNHVVYHNAGLTRQVEHNSRSAMGYFLDSQDLRDALKTAAAGAGAKMRSSQTRPAIRLEEEQVVLLGTTQTVAKVLMISYNRPGDVISDLALPVQSVPQPPMVVAALDVPIGGSDRAKGLGNALHVVEMRERSDLGMFFVAGRNLHIRLISASVASGTRAEELSSLVSKLQRASVIPSDLPLGKARGAVWYPPAGMALELETHVAKRCLLIGTAGGFAESITGQTLYPSIRSAMLAADIALSALGHANLQEDLMRYKVSWRKTLADYLRPPNTSLQMLLPLLFVNRQIVAKFTKALLLGENI